MASWQMSAKVPSHSSTGLGGIAMTGRRSAASVRTLLLKCIVVWLIMQSDRELEIRWAKRNDRATGYYTLLTRTSDARPFVRISTEYTGSAHNFFSIMDGLCDEFSAYAYRSRSAFRAIYTYRRDQSSLFPNAARDNVIATLFRNGPEKRLS
jgi:hypothetical protein